MPIYRPGSTGTEPLRRPRLPRLGIIRLGYKETRKRPDGSEYPLPRAASHFVLTDAPAVAEVYGERPTVLEPVYLPLENEDIIASHYYRMYGTTWGQLCKGDGRTAQRQVDPVQLKATGEAVPAGKDTKRPVMMTVNCPCPYLESGDCRESLFLQIMLPNVPGLGVWQLSTGSANSIANIQGFLETLRAVPGGRITGVPMKLSLVPQRTISYERGGPVTVHVLTLDLAEQMTIKQLASGIRNRSIGILPPPDESPPDDYLPDEDGIEPEIPPVEEWTPKKDLAEAQAQEPAQPQAPPTPEPQPAAAGRPRGRPPRSRQEQARETPPPVDPVAQGLSPEAMAELRAQRSALAELVRELVPQHRLSSLADDLKQWFGGKSRIVELTPDELRQAGPRFREKYGQAQEAPSEPEAPPDESRERQDLWTAIRAAAQADQAQKFALHQALVKDWPRDWPGFTAAQFDLAAPPEALSTEALRSARSLVPPVQ